MLVLPLVTLQVRRCQQFDSMASLIVWFSSFRRKPETIRASAQRLYRDTDLRRCDQVRFLDAELILFDRLHHIIPRFLNIGILPEINGIEVTLLQSVNQVR